MENHERGALLLVRFIAVALMAWSVLELGLYWAVCHHQQQSLAILPCVIKSLPLIAGVLGLIKAKAMAAWLVELME